ncbi:hypothetical protein F5X98DRAFT_391845 [Xylaria grammica]|nr:hypothetical protein F5X98DRAFT_391845 [Xylaria grammica]
MELSASIWPFICPTAVFLEPSTYKLVGEERITQSGTTNTSQEAWDISLHNPATKMRKDGCLSTSKWCIDGCASSGTQFFGTLLSPDTSLPTPIRRIDIHIPDQAMQPPSIRNYLRSTEAMYTSNSELYRLPLIQYIQDVLTTWSSRVHHFDTLYRSLPFGSRIAILNLSTSPDQAEVRLLPRSSIETLLAPAATLAQMWPDILLPPKYPLDRLELVKQMTDAASLVRIPEQAEGSLWVFKSSIEQPKYIYHELKILLQLQPHPHVLPRPKYIITDSWGSKSCKVYGFLVEFFKGGNLGQAIERHKRQNTLTSQLQVSWALQLVSGLRFMLASPAGFYSELKPDNIVCDADNKLILIDMEQSGNWETFTAPEIYYVEHLIRLCHSNLVPHHDRLRYREALGRHLSRMPLREGLYSNPAGGYFEPWKVLTPQRREAAMVYSLGKVLWCIFERWSHTTNGMDEEYSEECDWEFPECRRCPRPIQTLIQQCTQGSPSWDTSRRNSLIRVGTKIYPRETTNKTKTIKTVVTGLETLEFSKEMWRSRLKAMDEYLETKERWETGKQNPGDESSLGFPLRPTLDSIQQVLENLNLRG